MKKEKSCGAIVYHINKDNEIIYLIIEHLDGHWGFPKGHVENNETEIETSLREVKEETGLNIEILNGFREMITYSPKENVIKDVVYFIGFSHKLEYILQKNEVRDAKWLKKDDILEYLVYNDEVGIFKKGVEFINKG